MACNFGTSITRKLVVTCILILFYAPVSNAEDGANNPSTGNDCTTVIHAIDRFKLESDRDLTEARVMARLLRDADLCLSEKSNQQDTDANEQDGSESGGQSFGDSTQSQTSDTGRQDTQDVEFRVETVERLESASDDPSPSRMVSGNQSNESTSLDSLDQNSSPSTQEGEDSSSSGNNNTSSSIMTQSGVDSRNDSGKIDDLYRSRAHLLRDGSTEDERKEFQIYREGELQWAVSIDEFVTDEYARVLYEAFQAESDPARKKALGIEIENRLKQLRD